MNTEELMFQGKRVWTSNLLCDGTRFEKLISFFLIRLKNWKSIEIDNKFLRIFTQEKTFEF